MKIKASLDPGVEEEVVWVLRENRDSISLGARPMSQKKRRLGEEKKRVVKAKTAKLLQERFIREVKYPSWLSNVVMVKKPSDLNRACPKDPYPLPSIDTLVDGASGCRLLSFMDAYSSYNQIRVHPSDESKTTFIMDNGNFCYKVMSFGLKNVGATYQRLIDQIFKDHIGGGGHAENLTSIFRVLRRYQLRLNPKKCSFGVKIEKFLGFMLTRRGIKVNLEKCNAVIDMRSPRSVKEEEEGEQQPIYYISKVLQGAELRYQKIKKVSLAIIVTAKKLRSYFQSHPVTCRTDLPIKQILQKLDLVGRTTGWVVELFEFDMAYEGRGHMKA
ncbi:hypothetical protein CR513_30480, partial [Mucuna pruriens]